MINRPDIVKLSNQTTGGVDLADMLISLYRSPFKTWRWYLVLVAQLLDICKVNAWLLYRRYANQLGVLPARQMALAEFTSKIAHARLKRDKPIDRWPTKQREISRFKGKKGCSKEDSSVRRRYPLGWSRPLARTRFDKRNAWNAPGQLVAKVGVLTYAWRERE